MFEHKKDISETHHALVNFTKLDNYKLTISSIAARA